jgi:outer membrane protein assembly factor BamC
VKIIFKTTLICSAISLISCSYLQADKVDYKSAAKPAPPLSIPPDLSQLSKDTRYSIIDGSVSASGYQASQKNAVKAPIAATEIGDVRIERSGNQRWLVVKRPTPKVWDITKEFWLESGFSFALDQRDLGIMETDWAENRAKLSQGTIQSFMSKIFNSISSTAERDKYRTRLETNAAGETEIYISHRGLYEVYTEERSNQTVWQPRAADPELETEFLRRLMLKLGASTEQTKDLGNSVYNKPTAELSVIDGRTVILLEENFDRAWRRVGLSLDRSGFTVEDRDRKQGIYYVRYISPNKEAVAEQGFFGKLFNNDAPKVAAAQKYWISVKAQATKSVVSVLNDQGLPEQSSAGEAIAKLIAQDLK